ncbi:MAG: ABC transporter permease [Phycisphaerales bacterium]
MPAFLNWLLRLGPTNPICMRLVTGGSKRTRHLLIRSGYLAVMIIVLLASLLGTSQANSLRELASGGANAFRFVAYLQLSVICLLAPVFMAGAIAQEANPRTWDILLTTPLNSLQIVLGNLFGRLFFIIGLLVSSLPLFGITQYFGGVPGSSIFASYAIAGAAALIVGAIAIALSVSRQAGRRAVFMFYLTVVVYLGITWSLDLAYRPTTPGHTTWFTPLNPFLVQETLLNSAKYQTWTSVELADYGGFARLWLGAPVKVFIWGCVLLSLLLIAWSTVTLRLIGQRVGQVPWYRRLFKLGAAEGRTRPAREVWKNPIAWREATAKRATMGKIAARYGFVSIGALAAFGVVLSYHFEVFLSTPAALQRSLMTLIATEVAIIALTAINISATAISREREDGTLDLLLTTPLTPAYYLTGKLRGIVSFVAPMMAVPIFTAGLAGLYVLANGLGVERGVTVSAAVGATRMTFPVVLPEGILVLSLVIVPFVAFCVMVGLNWSLKSKGTISSIIAAVGVIVVTVAVLSLCGHQAGNNVPLVGAVMACLSPITAAWSVVYPDQVIPQTLEGLNGMRSGRFGLVVGSMIAAAAYLFIVYGMHKAMLGPNGRNFDMTVRRLAGTN